MDEAIAREAKAIVVLAFRNGPIESLHAGRVCPSCKRELGYSRISDDQMKGIMKNAVDHVYRLLWMRVHAHAKYEHQIDAGERLTRFWDTPTEPAFDLFSRKNRR